MADTTESDAAWYPRSKIDEELEFFTELALHETERWIQVRLVHMVVSVLRDDMCVSRR